MSPSVGFPYSMVVTNAAGPTGPRPRLRRGGAPKNDPTPPARISHHASQRGRGEKCELACIREKFSKEMRLEVDS